LNKFNKYNEHIVDTDFIEVDIEEKIEDKDINREPLYYTRVQVAKLLNENESTISYWSKQFQPLLNIKIINMTRKYTKGNIENLMFIQKLLREDHLTIQQALEYCSKRGFDSDKGLIDTSNPLAIQTFISAMTVEFDKKIAEMQDNIIKKHYEMKESFEKIVLENNEDLKKEMCLTLDETVTEKMNEFKDDNVKSTNELKKQITNRFGELDRKSEERDIKLVEKLRDDTKDAKIKTLELEIEELKSHQHQGFLSNLGRLFGKKK
jgi:DNA-binding transcriptional MerR regulator